jgi:hypothetical protein
MLMVVYELRGQMKSVSHPILTPSAGREHLAAYRCNLMGMSVLLPIKGVMDYVINA